MGNIVAICSSKERGTPKTAVSSGDFTPEWGLVGDAHGGSWHRQVSLLAFEQIEAFNQKCANVSPGAFGENLVVAGLALRTLRPGARLRCGAVVLEITQIGKECHQHCAIYERMGDCIMPRDGLFARVVTGGSIRVGDEVHVERQAAPQAFTAAVVTLSDKGAAGARADISGPAIAARLTEAGYTVCAQILLADDRTQLENTLIDLCDRRQVSLILTTGGTGFSPRDITPEATLAVAHRQAPGIAEAMRAASMQITPRAMLSRAVSVVRGSTLIINLPGSPKACAECMDVFVDTLPHALELLRGDGGECASTL